MSKFGIEFQHSDYQNVVMKLLFSWPTEKTKKQNYNNNWTPDWMGWITHIISL